MQNYKLVREAKNRADREESIKEAMVRVEL
jgi:hypothetical protein